MAKYRGALLLLVLLAGATLTGAFGSDYQISFGLYLCVSVALAYSWNLLSGYTGYISFGHVSFFAIGQYAAGLLILTYGLPWLPASLIGGLIAAGFALPLGWVMLRLQGPYFSIGMLAVAGALTALCEEWDSLTHGSRGLYLPPNTDLHGVYWAAVGLLVLVMGITYRLENSRFGMRLLAIREDETAAEALGIRTARDKLVAFTLSAFFPGVLGGIWGWNLSYISPESAFSTNVELTMVVMVLFGGLGTFWGPLLGGLSLGGLSEFLWSRLPFAHLGIFGLSIIAMVLFMPRGIVPILVKRGILPASRRLSTDMADRIRSLYRVSPLEGGEDR